MSKFKGKNVLVVGFGLSGASVARYLVKQGARVTVTDTKQKAELLDSIKLCNDLKIQYDLGRHNSKNFLSADLIVVSPGVPLNIRPLEEAREKNIPITNEVEMSASALKVPLIAVTGTNGKTTICTLLGKIFEAEKKPAFVGGNIGRPLIDYHLEEVQPDVVVAELSSFQLELVERMVPAVAVFTNFDQDHLDRYPDMDAYIAAKRRLLRVCDKNSYVVLNYDDPNVRKLADEGIGKVMWFTKQNPIELNGEFAEQFCGAYFDAEAKTVTAKITGREEVYDVAKLRLFGDHNRENLMAAICSARVMGVSPKSIQTVINTFEGVEHRLEFVRRKNGAFFISTLR